MRILYLPNEYSQQRQREKPANIYPVRMAMEATWYLEQGHSVFWNDLYHHSYDKVIDKPEGLPFLDLPSPDRIRTNAKSYTSGNYKYTPGTHMQVADGCWHGTCIFCAEKGKEYVVRPLDDVMEELVECKKLGFKEVFDDSGTFPAGDWLTKFCIRKINSSVKDLPFSCNIRIGAKVDFKLMKQAGFRMILIGLESSNQYTLNRIKKGIKANEIIPYIKEAARAGLEPHIAVMFGYAWETEKEELKTLDLVHYLLRKGYAKTAQASLYRVPGMDPIDRRLVKRIYEAGYSPEFWINKIKDIRSLQDISYLCKGIKAAFK